MSGRLSFYYSFYLLSSMCSRKWTKSTISKVSTGLHWGFLRRLLNICYLLKGPQRNNKERHPQEPKSLQSACQWRLNRKWWGTGQETVMISTMMLSMIYTFFKGSASSNLIFIQVPCARYLYTTDPNCLMHWETGSWKSLLWSVAYVGRLDLVFYF